MAVFTFLTKATTTFVKLAKRFRSFLLKEDGFYLLKEDGGKIIIQPDPDDWTNLEKH